MFTKLRMRFGIPAALLAVLALALPAAASALPLGATEEFTGATEPMTVAAGPEGNLWFTDNGTGEIGRITPGGTITEYAVPGAEVGFSPRSVALGSDGKIWFTIPISSGFTAGKIGRCDPANCGGTLEEFSTGLQANAAPLYITAGPDGNLWFSDDGGYFLGGAENPIGRITTGAVPTITEYGVADGLNPGGVPTAVTPGSGGTVWFADEGTNAMGRVTTGAVPTITEWEAPGATAPDSVTLGPDGNVWFTRTAVGGKAIGSVTPTGTFKLYNTPEVGISSLTLGPDGNLWARNVAGKNEKQEIKIEAGGTLGGTYKLKFEGQSTGWTGAATLTGESGTGTLSASSGGTGKVTKASKIITEVTAPTAGAYAVGQILTVNTAAGTPTIPANDTIAKIPGEGGLSSTELELTTAAAGTGTPPPTVKTLTTGSKTVSSVTGGPYTATHTIEGTGIPASTTIASCAPSCEAATSLTLSKQATIEGAGVALAAGTKSVTGATTTTGKLVNGEQISGTGIQAGTTISSVNEEAGTFTLSKVASSAGAFSLSADLPFGASAGNIGEALEKLSSIGAGNVAVEGSGATSPVTRTVEFKGKFIRTNVPLIECDGTNLTGTSPSCSVETTQNVSPNKLLRFNPETEEGKEFSLEPVVAGTPARAGTIAPGPDGNLWLASGGTNKALVKFGIETAKLTAKIEAGSGTVVFNPAGIECSGAAVKSCSESFAKEAKVTLTASPAAGYLFKGWKYCDKTEGGYGVNGRQCTVKMSAAKTVGASFVPAYSLTGSKASGSGPGSLSTAPGGLSCATNCSSSTALYKAGTLTVNAKPGKHFHLVEFKGGSGSAEGCDEETTCSFTIAANSSIEALFAEDAKFDLSLEKEGGGQGSVKSSPGGISCAYTCTAATASYYTGEVVSISVALNKGTESVTWTTAAGTCTGSATSCSVTMGEAHELVAKFE